MPISIAAMVLGGLLLASSSASAQSKTGESGSVNGSAGLFGGSLSVVDESNAVYGGWFDIAFTGWELGDVEVDIFQSRRRQHRVESCPYADCSPRYESDAEGKPKLISDPTKVPALATESQRLRRFSVALLRKFRTSQRAAPHFIVGVGRFSRELSFAFDNPGFDERTHKWRAWGPVAGVGLDVFAGRFIARLQYQS